MNVRHNNVVLDQHRLLAFCIPKCANTSIKVALLQGMGVKFTDRTVQRHPAFRFAGPQELSDPRYNNWYSFTIVRNPWERAVSCWTQKVKRRGWNNNFHGFDKFGVTDNTSFEKFVRIIAGVPDAESNIHFQSQMDLISWKGRILPKHIARMETLTVDWKHIKNTGRLELPDLEHHTISEHPHYRQMYTAETQDLIRQRYGMDIKELDYDF